MESTSHSLLEQVSSGAPNAWWRLNELYRPFLYRWFRRGPIPHADAEDLVQETMLVVARELPAFVHCGRRGAFRRWLRNVTVYIEKSYWRSKQSHGQSVGGTAFSSLLQQVEDSGGELDQMWDREHDRYVLAELLRLISVDFQPQTMKAFQRLAIDGASPREVAEELGMSVGAVYVAKSRVMQRLRTEAREFLENLSES